MDRANAVFGHQTVDFEIGKVNYGVNRFRAGDVDRKELLEIFNVNIPKIIGYIEIEEKSAEEKARIVTSKFTLAARTFPVILLACCITIFLKFTSIMEGVREGICPEIPNLEWVTHAISSVIFYVNIWAVFKLSYTGYKLLSLGKEKEIYQILQNINAIQFFTNLLKDNTSKSTQSVYPIQDIDDEPTTEEELYTYFRTLAQVIEDVEDQQYLVKPQLKRLSTRASELSRFRKESTCNQSCMYRAGYGALFLFYIGIVFCNFIIVGNKLRYTFAKLGPEKCVENLQYDLILILVVSVIYLLGISLSLFLHTDSGELILFSRASRLDILKKSFNIMLVALSQVDEQELVSGK